MRLFAALSLSSCVLLAGCSASFSPNAASPGTASAGARISGSVHGGRQPIAGAHIFLFAAGTSAPAGPGVAASTANQSVSLLTSSSASGYATTLDSSGDAASNPTFGDYYVTTDAAGRFNVGGEYACTPGSQVYLYSLGGDTGSGSANSAAGLLAVLGQCPASGTMASVTPNVAVSEVSTVAAAYALAGYATDATHISSSGSTAALTGIANAFANASMLYDVSGNTNNGAANTSIPGNATSVVASGSVNSLANSLAACVNSSGPSSPQCADDLFDVVRSEGASGTVATETATEAIYIAHHPGAAVSTVFNNAVAIGQPWQPALTAAPNDWTMGVSLFDAGISAPFGVAIDAQGNSFIYGRKIVGFSPQGLDLTPGGFAPAGSFSNGVQAAVDNSGYVWAASWDLSKVFEYWGANATAPTTPGTLIGTFNGGSLYEPLWPSIDANGNIWVGNGRFNINVYYGSSAPAGHNPGDVLFSGAVGGGMFAGRYSLQDFRGDVWFGHDNGLSQYCSTNPGCTLGAALTASSLIPTGAYVFYPTALDAQGNLWATGLGTSTVVKAWGFNAVTPNSPGDVAGTYTGGGLDDPLGIAVDGSGNVWALNYDYANRVSLGLSTSVSEFTNAGVALSPSTGYTSTNNAYLTDPNKPGITGGPGIAIDGSGNVWITNETANSVEILIGAATPVVTPLSANLVAPYGAANVNRP